MILLYLLSVNTVIYADSLIFEYETECNALQFKYLENLIGSLHQNAPERCHLLVRDTGLTSGQRKLLSLYQNVKVTAKDDVRKRNTQVVGVESEFVRMNGSLINRANKGQYYYTDFIRKRTHLALVIPFIDKQIHTLIERLELEVIYPPCHERLNFVDLIFYHANKRRSDLDMEIRQINYENKCFKSIQYFSANLKGKEDKYPVGSANMWRKLFINEDTDDVALRYHGYTHFFLMEPDTKPIRPYWLDAIVAQISNGKNKTSYMVTQWWMLGSIYRGSAPIPLFKWVHINGNALYHLSLSFIQYLNDVSYAYPFDSSKSLGYDLDIFLYLLENVAQGKKFWHKFQFSDFIQNCWHTSCNETNPEFLSENPNTFLIHGNMIKEDAVEGKGSYLRTVLVISIILILLVNRRRIKYFCQKLCTKLL